jgi:aspartate/methionine/tyrosine aminotransferase
MRTDKLQSFRVMDVVREAQQYDDAIHFEIGQPDLPPAPAVKAALHRAIDEDRFAYTESLGLLALREKIAAHYAQEQGVTIDPGQILITPGTSTAFLIAYLLTLEQGGVLGLADPSYPCYKNFAHMVDVEPLFLPIGVKDGYQLTPEHLAGKRMDALHISSPSNPTGTVYSRENLEELMAYCRTEGITFISDELYHGLVYDEVAASAVEFGEEAIVINGFSKYFTMPGLRLGWMVLPEQLVRPAEIIAQNLYISAPTLSQYAALEAFDYDYLSQVRKTFRERRDFLYEALGELFAIDARPDGAFYLWADVSRYSDDAVAFAEELLKECHVAITPGVDFGTNGTRHYLRFSYTREIAHMREGVERLKEYLRERKSQ